MHPLCHGRRERQTRQTQRADFSRIQKGFTVTVDLKWILILSMALAVLGFLGGAGSQFTDLGLSPIQVKAVIALFVILLGVGNAINSVLIAFGMNNASRIASVQQVPLQDRITSFAANDTVSRVVLKDQNIADASMSSKVVGPNGH